ncbi:MAG: hypothetical protein WD883_01750 [Candidatus Colwellbacteria bacterium]
MQNLFLELTLLVSLAIIVYLMSAALPRIEEEDEGGEESEAKRSTLPLDKLDQLLIKAKDKFLRKVKVVIMKADNFISRQLKGRKHQ